MQRKQKEMRSANKSPAFFIKFILVVFVVGCSNKYVDDIKRGAGYEYKPGYPELRVEIAGSIDEDNQPKLLITGNIVHQSLIFKEVDGELISEVTIEISYSNTTTNHSDNISFSATINKDSPSDIYGEDIYFFEREVNVAPGDYTVDVIVTDQSSRKKTIQSAKAYLPNPEEKENSNITNIRILANYLENNAEFTPVTTYDVGLGADTLKFIFQITNNDQKSINVESRLIKFRSDTTISRPMSYNNYKPSHIAYKGIDYDNYKVIQSSSRELNQPGSVVLEFAYTDLGRGNYRFEVARDLDNKGPLYKARDFSVKSENYPSLKTPRELAQPLYYLMSEKEHAKLMSIKSPDSLKNEIDRFWLSDINNSRIAKYVISLYYERVEQANKQFSNFKEGWKTDAGRMYILFGPPLYIDKRINEMQWSYAYDRSDPEYNFYFRLPKLKNSFYPFENYILQRKNFYFTLEYQQIELWKTGTILTKKL